MFISYKYPLYPTKEQVDRLNQWLGANRWLYNHFLEKNIKFHNKKKKFLFYNKMASKLVKLKSKYEWLKDVNSQTLQQTLKTLEKAIKAVFTNSFGFPKFRRYGNSYSITIPQHFRLDRGYIYIPKFKEGIRFNKYRWFRGKPKELKILKENNQFFVVIVCEIKENSQIKPNKELVLGLDVGTVRLATTSNNKYKKPLDLTKELRLIKHYQRELERRSLKTKKGKLKKNQSNRRVKTFIKLQKIHRHIANKRRDYLQKYTSKLVRNYDYIVVEDLHIKNMTKSAKGTKEKPGKNVKSKSGLNREITKQGWYYLFSMLEYKLQLKGGNLIKVDPKYTSQTCNKCGFKSKKNRKTQSEFKCIQCGHTINADQNASRNIRDKGLKQLGLAA